MPDQVGRPGGLVHQLRRETQTSSPRPSGLRLDFRELDGVSDVRANVLQADLGSLAARDLGDDEQDRVRPGRYLMDIAEPRRRPAVLLVAVGCLDPDLTPGASRDLDRDLGPVAVAAAVNAMPASPRPGRASS